MGAAARLGSSVGRRLTPVLRRAVGGSPEEDERMRSARAGGALLLLGGATGIVLLAILPPHIDRGLALAQALLCCTAGLLMPQLPWPRWPRPALLAPVGLAVLVVFLGGGVADRAIDYYALFLPLAFIYMGLTFPPLHSFYLFGVCLVGVWTAMLVEQPTDVLPYVLLGLVLSTVSGTVLARQRRTEQETYRAMQRLVETATTLGAARSPHEVAELVAEATADLLEADGVAVLLRPGRGATLGMVAQRLRPVPGSSADLLGPAMSGLVAHAALSLEVTDHSQVQLSRDGREVGTAFVLRGDHEVVGGVVVLRVTRGRLPAGTAARTVLGLGAEAGRVLQRLLVTEDLVRSATVDGLTGVSNRAALDEALVASGPGDVVALVDLDHFKRVNDTLGHAAGDQVLRDFGAVLRRCSAPEHVVARYGGEEFVTLLPGCDEAAAAAYLSRLRQAWAASGARVTFSSGIARRSATEDPTLTLARADLALYQAKRGGRDQDVVAAPAAAGGAAVVPGAGDRLSLRPAAPA